MAEERDHTQTRRRALLAGAAALAIVVLVVAVVLASGGDDEAEPRAAFSRGPTATSPTPSDTTPTPTPIVSPTGPGAKGGEHLQTPTFVFDVVSARRIIGRSGLSPAKLRRATRAAVRGVRTVLDRFYTQGYLRPQNWRRSDYSDAFAVFTPQARRAAVADRDRLTLGAGAGKRYRTVRPAGGTLRVRVLVDRHGRGVAVSADTTFQARARALHGDAVTVVKSRATYFLQPVHGLWRIAAYHAERHQHPPKGDGDSK